MELTERRSAGLDFRGLVWTLIRTDFRTRYHGTLGGFVWALLKPVTMFAVLLGVFSFVFAADPLYKLNLVIGLFVFDFFAESTRLGLISLYQKGYLLNKARFPTSIVALTSASNPFITLTIYSVVILTFLTVSRGLPSVTAVVLFVLYLSCLLCMVAGISLAGSVLFLRYRDLNQLWSLVIQAGFFAAPVVYPLSIIPDRFHFYLHLWPPTPIIEFSRAVLVERTPPSAAAHGLLLLMTAVILGVGTAIYRRLAPRSAEYL